MRKLLHFSAVIFPLLASLYATAQDVKPFVIQLLTPQGSPITDARLIRPSGEELHPDAEGIIVYQGEDDYVKKNGPGSAYIKTKVMPHYIKIKSASFKEILVDLTKYSLGADIVLTMQRLDPETKKLNVIVKNRLGKPIEDAFVMVTPGTSTSTDEHGRATTTHREVWGEYITVNVSANGYKTQEKRIMSGRNLAIIGSQGVPVVPEDVVNFVLDKTVETFPLIIEVLDSKDDSPVLGAKVELKAQDGTVVKDLTNTSGECKLIVPESSFKGITSRAVVTKTGYEEKWSDVAGELTLIKSEYDRKVVVYIKKKEEKDKAIDISGTWKALNWIYKFTQNGKTFSWKITNDAVYNETATGEFLKGNSIKATWTNKNGTDSGNATVIVENDRAIRIEWSNGIVFMRQ